MKKTTKTKVLNWSRLSEATVVIENQKLLTQARDRVRKYNKKYGTNYKVNLPTGTKLTDRELHTILEQITTKNIKKIEADKATIPGVVTAYTVNGVMLTRSQYKQMQELQKKANALRGKNFNGEYYYKPYFNTYAGYERYIKTLEKVSTMEGYLEGIARGLQTFKESLMDHLDDLLIVPTLDADKKAEITELYDWLDKVVNTYSRLDKLYKFLKASGYTGEQIARLFFDSDPVRSAWQYGEDEQIIRLLKMFKNGYTDAEGKEHKGHWTAPQKTRLYNIDKTMPLTATT